MRLKWAGSLCRCGAEESDWSRHIARGETVEVAGYPLNERLLASIEGLGVVDDSGPRSEVLWLELGASEIAPATGRIVASWAEASYELRAVSTPLFWQIPETFSVPELHPLGLALVGD